jgi:hypothetical protein
MAGRFRGHYAGDYKRRAQAVRDAANADPATRCMSPVCVAGNGTLAQHPRTRTGERPTWDAGHVRDGDPMSPLQPEVSTCNRSAGARLGNRRRGGLHLTHQW